MSRLAYGFDGVAVTVPTNDEGVPLCVDDAPVVQVLSHHREWIGVLEGEPQRDVWRVQVGRGLCELHHLTYPNSDGNSDGNSDNKEPEGGSWLLVRWED